MTEETNKSTLLNTYNIGKLAEAVGAHEDSNGTMEWLLGAGTLLGLTVEILAFAHPHVTAACILAHSAVGLTGVALTAHGAARAGDGEYLASWGSYLKDKAVTTANKAGITLFGRSSQATSQPQVEATPATPGLVPA